MDTCKWIYGPFWNFSLMVQVDQLEMLHSLQGSIFQSSQYHHPVQVKWWELLLYEFLHEGVLVLQKEIPKIDPDLRSGFPPSRFGISCQIHNVFRWENFSRWSSCLSIDLSFLLVSRKMTSIEIKKNCLPHHEDGMPWKFLNIPRKYIFDF